MCNQMKMVAKYSNATQTEAETEHKSSVFQNKARGKIEKGPLRRSNHSQGLLLRPPPAMTIYRSWANRLCWRCVLGICHLHDILICLSRSWHLPAAPNRCCLQ
jgi:hypothetical protein